VVFRVPMDGVGMFLGNAGIEFEIVSTENASGTNLALNKLSRHLLLTTSISVSLGILRRFEEVKHSVESRSFVHSGPSAEPSGAPSWNPSRQPSGVPSGSPSSLPLSVPSTRPSGTPSEAPSVFPYPFTLSGSSVVIEDVARKLVGTWSLPRSVHGRTRLPQFVSEIFRSVRPCGTRTVAVVWSPFRL
jgi:hypothetical protein